MRSLELPYTRLWFAEGRAGLPAALPPPLTDLQISQPLTDLQTSQNTSFIYYLLSSRPLLAIDENTPIIVPGRAPCRTLTPCAVPGAGQDSLVAPLQARVRRRLQVPAPCPRSEL